MQLATATNCGNPAKIVSVEQATPPIMGIIGLAHSAARLGSVIVLDIRAAGAILLKQGSPSRDSGGVPSYTWRPSLTRPVGEGPPPARDRPNPASWKHTTQSGWQSDQSTRFGAHYVNLVVPFPMNDPRGGEEITGKNSAGGNRRMKCSA